MSWLRTSSVNGSRLFQTEKIEKRNDSSFAVGAGISWAKKEAIRLNNAVLYRVLIPLSSLFRNE